MDRLHRVGSYLKDERLTYYLGDRYRDYQSRVSGYPGIWFGPLGRVPTTKPQIHLAGPTGKSAKPPTTARA